MNLILCGGGSGKQNELANQKLNQIINHNKPILYIPLAMDEKDHPYDSCYTWIKEELKDVIVPSIDMVRDFEELSIKDLFEYSALFIGGGNTYKLLKGLKETESFNKIRQYIQNNGIVIGGSAGAVIFGKYIDIISSMDDNNVNLKETSGFNVLDGLSVFPHYTNKKSKLTEAENQLRQEKFNNSIKEFSSTKGNVIAIPEEDAIVVSDDSYEVIGTLPYYLVKDGIIEKKELN